MLYHHLSTWSFVCSVFSNFWVGTPLLRLSIRFCYQVSAWRDLPGSYHQCIPDSKPILYSRCRILSLSSSYSHITKSIYRKTLYFQDGVQAVRISTNGSSVPWLQYSHSQVQVILTSPFSTVVHLLRSDAKIRPLGDTRREYHRVDKMLFSIVLRFPFSLNLASFFLVFYHLSGSSILANGFYFFRPFWLLSFDHFCFYSSLILPYIPFSTIQASYSFVLLLLLPLWDQHL